MNWKRAFWSGVFGSTLMMSFIDTYNMLGLLDFSYEKYLGSAIRATAFGTHNWTLGLFANWIVGGVFGFFYAYCFEYVFKQANARIGIWLGFGHAVLASVAFFPFFGLVHNFLQTGVYPDFGIFGSGIHPGAPILLLVGHLLFGATVGIFYGPVRVERIRARIFEPGPVATSPHDVNLITPAEDPEDRSTEF